MTCHRARRAIAPAHQGARIITEHRERDPTEMLEGGSDALAPIVLPLVQKRFHERATRITEDNDQQKDRDCRAGDRHALLAEVDLHLRARRRFHAHGRDVGRALGLPHRRDRALHGAQSDRPALVTQQPMHDDGIVLGRTGVQPLPPA